MRYLLDANVISAVVVDPRGKVADRIAAVGEERVFTSVIVRGEILFGLRKRNSEELTRKVGNVLGKMFIAALDPPVESFYADIRLQLHKTGTLIGPNDLWIAAHSMALDAVLVTGNEKEFSRVPGLKMENWLR